MWYSFSTSNDMIQPCKLSWIFLRCSTSINKVPLSSRATGWLNSQTGFLNTDQKQHFKLMWFFFLHSFFFRMANFETPDLAFSSKEGYGEDSGLAVYVAQAIDPTLKWEDIAWLKRITSLPVVVKGVLRGECSRWEEWLERLRSPVCGLWSLETNHWYTVKGICIIR